MTILLSGNLVAETSAYQTILQYARIKQLKQYVEKEQLLYSLINRYVEETGRTPADADTLITYFDLPETTSIFDSFAKNIGDGKIAFSLENNSTLNISNVLGNLNAVYGTEVGGQLLDYYRKASDRSAVASVVGDNNVSYPVSESAKGVLRIHSGLDSDNAVMLSQKEFAEKQGEGFTEEEKSKTYYIPTGKGNVDVRVWGEEGWKSLGSVWDLNKGEILVDSEEELAQVHAFKGMKALMISGSSATENVYTGEQWVTFGGGSGSGGSSDLGDLNISMGQQFVGYATLEDIVQEIFDREAGSRAMLVDFSSDKYRAALNYDVATHDIVQMEKRDISIDDVSTPHWFYAGSEDGKVFPLYAIDSNLDDETSINDFVDVLVDSVGMTNFYLYSKNCYFDDDFSAVGEARYLGRDEDGENQFLYIAQGFIKLVRTYDCINMPRNVQVFGEVSNIFYKNVSNDYWANDVQIASFIGELENEEGNVTIVARNRDRLGDMSSYLATFPDTDKVAKLKFFTVDEADCDVNTCYYNGTVDNGYDQKEGYRFKYLPNCEQYVPAIKHVNCLTDYVERGVGAFATLTEEEPAVFMDNKVLFREDENYFFYQNGNPDEKCLAAKSGSSIICSEIRSLPPQCEDGSCGGKSGEILYAGSKKEGIAIQSLSQLAGWYPENNTRAYYQNYQLIYQVNRYGGYWYTKDYGLVVGNESRDALPADKMTSNSEIYTISRDSTQPQQWSYTKSGDFKDWGEWVVKNRATNVATCEQHACRNEESFCLIGSNVYQWDSTRSIYYGIDGKNSTVADEKLCREYELLENDVDGKEGGYFVLELGKANFQVAQKECEKRKMHLPTEEETRYLLPHKKGNAWTANRYGSVWGSHDIRDATINSQQYVKCVYINKN